MAVTLRNLPKKLDQTIQRRAKEKGISVNKAVITLLEEQLGMKPKKHSVEYHDLDNLAGSWTKAEADAFDKTLTKQRAIDSDLWT
jgi:DNA polymerase III delta subunit